MRFKVLFLALCILIIDSVTPAQAGPVIGAVAMIGKAISAFAASSWIGGVIVGIGKSMVFGLLAQAVGKLFMKEQKAEPIGIVLEVQMGDDNPLSFIVGSRGTAAKRNYWGTWGSEGGTPNAYFVDELEVGALPSFAGPQGIVSLWAGEEKCTILWDEPHEDGRGYPVEEFRKSGIDYLWVKYRDGTQTEADPYLRTRFGADPDRPYLETMIGRGKQVLIVTARYNTELFSGAPEMLIEPAPLRFYDARKDSSVGGDGAHRWDDPSTWEPSYNNAVIIYNIVRGIADQNGQWVYGGQNVSAYRMPASSWMAAANECDREIANEGVTRPQYRCGAEISVADQPLDVIEQLRLGCNGRFVLSDGTVELLVGAPAAPVFSFTDGMIIRSSDAELDPWPSLSDTHNVITATWPDPESRWNMKDAPEHSDETFVAEDGRWLTHSIAFRAVPWAEQAQALQKTINQDGRRFVTHEFTLPPIARLLKPGNVVAWTSLRNSYQDKLFIIERIVRLKGSLQRVTLKELDPSDYDPPEIVIPPVTGWIGRISAPVQVITGVEIYPATIKDDEGRDRRPGVGVKVPGGMDGVTHIEVDVRVQTTGQVIIRGVRYRYEEPYDWIVDGQLPANTWLEVNVRYVSDLPTIQEWFGWVPVRTPDILLTNLDIYTDGVVEEVNAALGDYNAWMGEGTRELIETARQIAAYVAETDAAAYTDRREIRRELVSTRDGVTASYTEAITAATGPGSALVQSIETLEAEVQDLETGLAGTSTALSALTTRVTNAEGGITAVSQDLSDLSTTVSGVQTTVNGLTTTVGANTSAINALTTRVSTAEGNISSLSQSYTGLNSTVSGLQTTVSGLQTTVSGHATAISSLTTRVTTAENNITSVSQSLTDLTATVNGKASTTALNALQATVTAQGNTITAQGNALTALDSTVGNFSASGRFRVTTETTPSGALARIGLSVAASGSGSTSTAAMYLDALAGGESQIVANADRFAFLVNGQKQFPFVVDANGLQANIARFGTVTSMNLNINNRVLITPEGNVTIRNSVAGQRTEIANGLIRVYDANNVLRVRMGVW